MVKKAQDLQLKILFGASKETFGFFGTVTPLVSQTATKIDNIFLWL